MMDIKLIRVYFENIRDFDKLSIDVERDGKIPHIFIVQMANGTGKTTTHGLLRVMFSGKELTPDEILDLRPTNFEADQGKIEMVISINEKRTTITLELDYIEKTSKWYTTKIALKGGRSEGFSVDYPTTISYDFTKFFIFDGELAERLLKNNDYVATEAIEQLYGLQYLKLISQKAIEISENKIKTIEKSNVKSKQGFKNIQTRRDNAKTQLELLNIRLKNLESSIVSKKEQINAKDAEIQSLLSQSDRSQLEALNLERSETQFEIEKITEKIYSYAISPSNISVKCYNSIMKLYTNMEILKIPKSTSASFFKELCTCPECICGTKMTDIMRESILKKSEEYMSDDFYSILNSVKNSISATISEHDVLLNLYDKYENYLSKLGELEISIGLIKKRSDDADIEKRLNKLNKDYNSLKAEISTLESELQVLTDPDGTDSETNIAACKQELKKYQDALEEAEPKLIYSRKAKKFEQLTEQIYDKALDSLETEIINKTNARLEPRFGNEIKISAIHKNIKLEKKRGASTGQTLSVAYIYLTSLFEDSYYNFPFIIDSPCGSLDKSNRRFIANTLPNLFDNIIMFVSSSERSDFLELLYQREDINYLTIWKSHEGGYSIKTNTDLDFFNNFQDEE